MAAVSAAGTGIVGGPTGPTTQGSNEAFHSRRAEPTRRNAEESELGRKEDSIGSNRRENGLIGFRLVPVA